MHLDKRGSISSTLLESVKAQRPEAWRRLVDLYGQVVYRWCRKSGLKAEDAADVVQEVFTAVSKHIADFHRQSPRDSFTAWLSTITRNKISDHFRRIDGHAQAQGGTKAQEFMQEIPQGELVTEGERASGEPEGDSPIRRGGSGQSAAADLIEADRILARRAVELVRTEFEAAHLGSLVENGRRKPIAGQRGRRNGYVDLGRL